MLNLLYSLMDWAETTVTGAVTVFFVLPQVVLVATYLYCEYAMKRDTARMVREWDERDALKHKEQAHGQSLDRIHA